MLFSNCNRTPTDATGGKKYQFRVKKTKGIFLIIVCYLSNKFQYYLVGKNVVVF